jgi:bifunctional DNA-binding transcriptional regulator/antitoxin component of YhaV-PrlF toxin-antitoxin module
MFKTTVQTGGRISIPEAERNALGIEDGDLVQVIIIPLSRKKKNTS